MAPFVKLIDLDPEWPALMQVRQIKNFKTWACRPYPKNSRPQIPLFYTPTLGQRYPWTKPLWMLEKLTQGPVAQIFVFWIPLLIALSYKVHVDDRTGPIQLKWTLMGLCSWSFVEYWTHRAVFHNTFAFNYVPEFAFMVHFVHHKQPQDHWRLTMPLVMSLPLGSMILYTFWWLSSYNLQLTLSWGIGFGLGYICYDLMHFITHFSPVSTSLQRHHLAHHGLCHRKYGFTTNFWDQVFCSD